MKSLLKKIYYRLAAPFWQKVVAHIDTVAASERAARLILSSEAKVLQAEVDELKKLVEVQTNYVNELQVAGLHEMLAHYSTEKLQQPQVVLAAVVDVACGMEPALASTVHRIPADEIIRWVGLFSEQVALRGANLTSVRGVPSVENTTLAREDQVALLERQLEFNGKNHIDRERAASVEIARLNQIAKLAQRKANPAMASP